MDTISELEKFLLTEIALDHGPHIKSLDPDEDLFEHGIIYSLGVVKLMAFLEEKFNIKIKNRDIALENLRTLNCLKKFIESKQTNTPRR